MVSATALQAVIDKVTAKLANTNKQITERLAEDAATVATLEAIGFKDAERLALTLKNAPTLIDRRTLLESTLVKLSASLAALTPAITPEEAKETLQRLIGVCSKYDEFITTVPTEIAKALVGSSAQMDSSAWQEYIFKFDTLISSSVMQYSLSNLAKHILSEKAQMSPEHVAAVKARVAKEKAAQQAKRDAELRPVPSVAEYEARLAERSERGVPMTPAQQAKYEAAVRERQAEQQRRESREGRTNDGLRPMQEGGFAALEWELREG